MKNDYIHNTDGTRSIIIESLDRSLEIMISTVDFHVLENHPNKFCVAQDSGSRTWYVVSTLNGRRVYLHRLLKGEPKGMQVHHKDGNGLNNTRENLELLTPSEHRRKKRSKEPIVGDPTKGVKVHILSKAELNKKQKDRRYWFRLEVNGMHYGTFDCMTKLNLHANIADMVVNRELTDKPIYTPFLHVGHKEEHIAAVIKEVRRFFRTPDPSKEKVKTKKSSKQKKNAEK